MATAARAKSSRIDIRMTPEQKRQIEEAAILSGESLSQWSLGTLLASAREQLLAAHTMALSEESFNEFARLLDEPQDPTFTAFATQDTIWDE